MIQLEMTTWSRLDEQLFTFLPGVCFRRRMRLWIVFLITLLSFKSGLAGRPRKGWEGPAAEGRLGPPQLVGEDGTPGRPDLRGPKARGGCGQKKALPDGRAFVS